MQHATGKSSPHRIELSGKRFGRLTVIETSHRHGNILYWKCICDCGNEKLVKGQNLRTGNTVSCGCRLADIRAAGINFRHGKAKTKAHRSWMSMRRRCYDANDISYKNYGAKGITVCERWKSFKNFFADMGECPPDRSLDRIDPRKGYSPDNCRWADVATQALNRTDVRQFTAHGLTLAMPEWSRLTGINYGTLYGRLVKRGVNPQIAIPPVDRKFSGWKVEEV